MDSKPVKVTVTFQSMINIFLALLAAWVLYQIRDIVVLLVIVVAIVVAFSPIVKVWQKYMPRPLAIGLLYAIFMIGFLLVTALIVPPVVRQLGGFLQYVQVYLGNSNLAQDGFLQKIQNNITLILQGARLEALGQIVSQFRGSLSAVYSSTLGVIGGVVSVITVLVSSYYLLADESALTNVIRSFLPASQANRVNHIMDSISIKMGSWLRGQLLLMVIIGVLDGIALAIIGVPYALLLGLWAGLTEFLPYVGPILGAIPGIFLAFVTFGVTKAIIALIIYFVVQQLESQWLVPRIMSRALGLSPIVIIFALLIGAKLLGFIGLLIAIPIAAALSVVYSEWRKAS